MRKAEVPRSYGDAAMRNRAHPLTGPGCNPSGPTLSNETPSNYSRSWDPAPADIAEIIPEIHSKITSLEPPPALEPKQARFRLFDSITAFLKTVAKGQPLLFILDDLHWANTSSLLLLEFLAREIETTPILVLGTYRDVELSRRHPLSQARGCLIRGQGFLRVQLPG